MTRVPLERKVLSENDRLAADLRQGFERHGTWCVNLISSPVPARRCCWNVRWRPSSRAGAWPC